MRRVLWCALGGGSRSVAALCAVSHRRACHTSAPSTSNVTTTTEAATTKDKLASVNDRAKEHEVRHALHQSKLGMDGFTDMHYNRAADAFLEEVESFFDSLLTYPAIEDTQGEGGVVSLETSKHGIYLLNKQAPNVQIWLSSPLSGPHHYDMVVLPSSSSSSDGAQSNGRDGGERVVWRSDRDGHDLQDKLEEELSQIVGTAVRFPAPECAGATNDADMKS